ncbi:hypothetical protein AVEN_213425-1, partial [Araneus ventricosus]
EGSALPSPPLKVNSSRPEISSIHRAKANSTWKVPPTLNGMLEIVLVSVWSESTRSAQWPDFMVDHIKGFEIHRRKKRLIPLALVPVLLLCSGH